jgi:hypothetical protein
VPLTHRPAASSSVAASAPVDPVHAGNAPDVAHAIPSRAPPQQVHVQQRARGGLGFDYMPDIKTLPKPDELLLKPPYYLVLYASRRDRVEVECSHSPTLMFLSEYLKKWVKANHQDPDKVCPFLTIARHLAGPTMRKLKHVESTR